MSDIVLASHSPRRAELLRQIGVRFDTCGVDVDESVRAYEPPALYVERLALHKAQVCQERLATGKPVLGSDTTVVCDGLILGKPSGLDEAVEMLMRLSGRGHQVMTAIALLQGERLFSQVVTTDVYFRPLSQAECQRYWATGEPADKAGGYGIQGLGAVFVEQIHGSYSAVVGLPLNEVAHALQQWNIPIWHDR